MLASLLGTTGNSPEISPKPLWRRRWGAPVFGGAVAVMIAAVILMWNSGAFQSPDATDDASTEFVARGGAGTPGFGIKCVAGNGKRSSCTVGSTLVFDLSVPEPPLYFSVAAVSQSGVLVRYFPSVTEKSLRIEKGGIQQKGIQLGPEHAEGAWRVFGIFSPEPIKVQDVKPIIELWVKKKSNPVNGDFLVQESAMEVVAP